MSCARRLHSLCSVAHLACQGHTGEVSLTPGGRAASAAAHTRTCWVVRGRAHSGEHQERWLAGDEPHQAGDVSPGQGLPIDELQHISGNVKFRLLLTLQLLLQDQPGEREELC